MSWLFLTKREQSNYTTRWLSANHYRLRQQAEKLVTSGNTARLFLISVGRTLAKKALQSNFKMDIVGSSAFWGKCPEAFSVPKIFSCDFGFYVSVCVFYYWISLKQDSKFMYLSHLLFKNLMGQFLYGCHDL